MLQAWLTPRWALVGALLGALRLTFGGEPRMELAVAYWGTSYWGGAVAMLGGCLLLGAFRRLIVEVRACDAVWLGVGVALLANSRPYEGAILCVPVGVALLVWLCGGRRPPLRMLALRLALPLGVVLGLTGALMAEYDRCVTGDALLLPYQSHAVQYETVPVFLFQPLRPEPDYRHQALRDLHAVWGGKRYSEQTSFLGWLRRAWLKTDRLWSFFLGPTLTLPLLALPWTLRRPWMAFALASLGLMLFALTAISVWSNAHYAAPAAGLVYYVLAECLRRLTYWRFNGVECGKVTLALLLSVSGLGLPALALRPDGGDGKGFGAERARLLARLQSDGERHLVFVSYSAQHSAHLEWVYNEAVIESAKVVWAHDVGEASRKGLRDYFQGRSLWRLHADETPPRLEALPGP
jgi:hypothetical protein